MLMVILGRQALRQRMLNEPSDDGGSPLYVASNMVVTLCFFLSAAFTRALICSKVSSSFSAATMLSLRLRVLRELEAELEAELAAMDDT